MTTFVEYPASTNLRRLLSVRSLLLIALVAMIVMADRLTGFALPLTVILVVVAAQAVATVFGWLRLVASRRRVTDVEILVQLGIDVVALTALAYLTGGWTNPLVSLYLVPVAAAVTMLPARFAWAVAVAAVLCYSFVAVSYQPLVHEGSSMLGVFTMHVLGMWLTFVIAAGLIAYFGTTMTAMLRARARALAAAREANLRNEQIIAVATLAAGTAHELSTPLGSIAVIAGELNADATPHQRRDIELIVAQIDVCKDILRRLRDAPTPTRAMQCIDEFVHDVRNRFQLLRPMVDIDFRLDGDPPTPSISADPTLAQAILNLLNNAADASPHSVECAARWTPQQMVVDIHDRGPGFDGASRAFDRYAAPADGPTDMAEGMGMGLLLANATVERLGGSVHIANRDGGGTWVQVVLPLAEGVAAR
jgi:two-component system sensor histidine kinase RegB